MFSRNSATFVSLALVSAAGCFAACSGTDDPPAAVDDTGVPVEETSIDTGMMPIDTAPEADTAATDTENDASADTEIDASVDPGKVPSPGTKLSEMDLYSDIAKKTIASKYLEFKPVYELWADGLTKHRYVFIPKGAKIDNKDMDHWIFPVGTRFYKEFAKGGKRLETRIIVQYAPEMYEMGTFIWDDTESDATYTRLATMNVRGTTWDAPSQVDCQRCHEGEPGRFLGFSAMQLFGAAGGVDLAGLETAGMLKYPLVSGKDYGVPGTAVEKAALGYLHANCGHCHNPENTATKLVTDQVLRLYVDERVVNNSTMYKSIVNHATNIYMLKPYRVHGGNHSDSAVWERQSKRGTGQMPPIATKEVNDAGIAAVATWIDSLPPPPPDGGTGDAASGG